MNKPLISTLAAAIVFAALPALASPVSASANGQPTITSSLTGTQIAQSNDNQAPAATAPADSGSSQSNDEDK